MRASVPLSLPKALSLSSVLALQTLAKPSNPNRFSVSMAPKIDTSSTSEGNNAIVPSIPAPPRPIIHTIFGYLNRLSLRSVGLEFGDIPYTFGWELVVYVGTIPCPVPSEIEGGSSSFHGPFLENPETVSEVFESCSSEPIPDTTQRTGDVFLDDLFADLKDDSEDKFEESPVQREDSVPLISQTRDKRKSVKTVAKRARTPRARPQSRVPTSQTPSSSQPSKPSRKSARIAFKFSPRPSRPSAPIIEEISSSSSSLSGSDSEDPSFKQGTPVFSDSSAEQNPSIPTSQPSASKLPLKRKPRTTPLSKIATPAPQSKKPRLTTPSPMSDKHALFLKRNVVRGKVVNISFFKEHELGVFLNKLRAQG